jgi:hypothetical protein
VDLNGCCIIDNALTLLPIVALKTLLTPGDETGAALGRLGKNDGR